jgi:hypothetical protein
MVLRRLNRQSFIGVAVAAVFAAVSVVLRVGRAWQNKKIIEDANPDSVFTTAVD